MDIGLAMWTPGMLEMGVVLFICVLIFGKRLPGMIGDMGKGIKEFRRGVKEDITHENK